MQLYVDAHNPIPIRRQLAEQLKHFIESGGFPREQALPSIREMAGFLGINPNTVAGASTMTDLCRWHRGGATKPGGYLSLTRSYWCTTLQILHHLVGPTLKIDKPTTPDNLVIAGKWPV